MMPLPDFLSHYYEASDGPFRNLSDLPDDEAEAVLQRIRRAGDRFASQDGSGLTIWSSVHVPG